MGEAYPGGHSLRQCFLLTCQMGRDKFGDIFLTTHVCSRLNPKKKITVGYTRSLRRFQEQLSWVSGVECYKQGPLGMLSLLPALGTATLGGWEVGGCAE